MSEVPQLVWPIATPAPVYRAGRSTQPERGFSQQHRNGHLTIHLFAFAARTRIGDQEFAIAPGDMTLTPPGVAESFDFTRSGLHWYVRIIPGAATGGSTLRLGLHHRLGHRSTEARRRIELIAQDVRAAGGDPDSPAAWSAAASAQALVCWLASLERAAPPATAADACVAKAAAILRAQECAGLPIAEVARRAGMSQNRLASAFLARHGTTMTHYRLQHLIEAAKWMLESTDLPLATIRSRLEIRDPQRFNRLFRRATGLSPRAWLAEHAPTLVSSPRPPVPTVVRMAKPASRRRT